MYSLLLDSSSSLLSVGLAKDGNLLYEISYEAWQRQSESMVQEISNILEQAKIQKEDLGSVVCSKGPGSYTGVRIALSIAKTLCFALQIPLYLVSSLTILRNGERISVCVDNARGKRSYVGIYQGDHEVLKDCILDNNEVLSLLEKYPGSTLCGNTDYLGVPGFKANILANMAAMEKDIYKIEDPMGATPVYLKDDYGKGNFKTIVRKMLPSDLDAVMEIENSCFKKPYTKQQFIYDMTENPCAHLYSAVVDSEVVGFISFLITFNSASICQIAVKQQFRKKGIGNMLLGQLLKDLESQSDPVEFLTLEVRASNATALSFYKKHKFQNITTKKAYYDDGEDAFYLVRTLING